jgi:hypothetical protein
VSQSAKIILVRVPGGKKYILREFHLYFVTYLDAATSVSGFTACAAAPSNTHLDDDWSGGFHRCTWPLACI